MKAVDRTPAGAVRIINVIGLKLWAGRELLSLFRGQVLACSGRLAVALITRGYAEPAHVDAAGLPCFTKAKVPKPPKRPKRPAPPRLLR